MIRRILKKIKKSMYDVIGITHTLESYREEHLQSLNIILDRIDKSELQLLTLQSRMDTVELTINNVQPRMDTVELTINNVQPRIDILELSLGDLQLRTDISELKLTDVQPRIDELEINNSQWEGKKDALIHDLSLQTHYQCQSLQQRIDQYLFDIDIQEKKDRLQKN
jgi:chromosome segregation ATPase